MPGTVDLFDNHAKSILDIDVKELLYQSQTAATYGLIINCISQIVGFQPNDILENLAEDVIKIMKDPNLDSQTRRDEVNQCLKDTHLDDDDYHKLFNLCRKIPDLTKDQTEQQNDTTDEPIDVPLDNDDDALSDEYVSEINDEDEDIEIDEIYEKNEESLRAQDDRLVDLDAIAKRHANNALKNNFGPPIENDGHLEYHIEPSKRATHQIDLIKISELPEFEQKAFSGFNELNYIQSSIYKKATKTDDSLLICAPTGSGKTNIAILTMLREINKCTENGKVDLNGFKIIYIAPIKALVQELVESLTKRLSVRPYNIKVEELTGDHQLTQKEILNAQIIVCTPEKWDIVTRKSLDRIYIKLVKLVIFDEIHLLHNERGATLEALISRIKRHKQIEGESIRIIGLSATLPNYKDVARFVSPNARIEDSTFYFNDSYRPIPLRQEYIAMTDSKQMFRKINDIVYNKLLERDRLSGDHQVLIFVHSRADTFKTADYLKTRAFDEGKPDIFLSSQSSNIKTELDDLRSNPKIQELVKFGIGVHHAGLSQNQRHTIEKLFRKRHLKTLVSTATLAWGVNLPARTVIIKGTQVYRDGRWTDLDSLDVTQMLGRAGRPGYDDKGEGIVITQQSNVYFYMSLMTEQLPVESRLIGRLPEFLNAECVIGSIQSLDDAVKWLSETYLSSRMMSLLENKADPIYMQLYGFKPEAARYDPRLVTHRKNLAYTAASILDNRGLIVFDRIGGTIESTELGRIASHFNCSSRTIKLFSESIYEQMSDIEILRTFSMAEEFKDIFVRRGEELDLKALIDQVPYPIDHKRATPGANKVNALLQVYIFRLDLKGSDLASDLLFVINNAARLARAIHEVVLLKKFARVAELSFDLCRKIDKRMTICHSPLRQFEEDLKPETISMLERKNYIVSELRLLKSEKLTELLRCDREEGKLVHKLLDYLPRYKLEASVKPVSRRCIRIDLNVVPEFAWDDYYHGNSQRISVHIEDVNQDLLLHHEVIRLRKHDDSLQTSFFVPYLIPVQPFYYIRTLVDGWFGCDQLIPVHVAKLTIPEDIITYIQPRDKLLLPFSELTKKLSNDEMKVMKEYEEKYNIKFNNSNFNQIQTHVFEHLYHTNQDTILLAPAGCGKTTCAELAILRNIREMGFKSKVGYIAANPEAARSLAYDWFEFFSNDQGVYLLSGNHHIDNPKVNREDANIIIGDATSWNSLLLIRSKKFAKTLGSFQLFIIDDIHRLYDDQESHLEWACSKIRIFTKLSDDPARIVVLGSPVLGVDSIRSWLALKGKVKEPEVFYFSPSVRPAKLDLTVQKFAYQDQAMRLLTMQRPLYRKIITEARNGSALIFVPDYNQALELSECILNYSQNDGIRFCDSYTTRKQFDDPNLSHYIKSGIGYIYHGMSSRDRLQLEELFEQDKIKILISTVKSCWLLRCRPYMTIIMDTQNSDGIESSDYSVTDLMQMVGLTGTPDQECKVVIMCETSKANLFETILSDALPIESHHNTNLTNIINFEIADKSIVKLNDIYTSYLAHTFFYKRIPINPNYYGVLLPDDLSKRDQTFRSFFNDLVNRVVRSLEENGFITLEGGHQNPDLPPTLLSRISLEYFICYDTLSGYVTWFDECEADVRNVNQLLDLVSGYTYEMSFVTVKSGDLKELRRLQKRHCPGHRHELHDPTFKVKLLLLSLFQGNENVEGELKQERYIVASLSHKVLMALVDIAWIKDSISLAEKALELSKKICLFKSHPHPKINLVLDSITKDGNTAKIIINVTREGDPFIEDEEISHDYYRDEGWFFIIKAKTQTNEDKFVLFKRVKAPKKGQDNKYSLICDLDYHSYELCFKSDFYPEKVDPLSMKNFLTSE